MAEKVIVQIEVDEKGAIKSIKNVEDTVEDVGKAADKTQKKTKGLGKAFKGVGVAVRGVGAAMKAAGIGLIIGIVASLTDVLMQNQAIMDGVNKAFNTLSIVFNQLTKPLFKVSDAIMANAEGFDALQRVGSNLLTLVLTPFKLALLEIEAGLVLAQLAWEKSFLGGQDEDKIKDLEDRLKGVGNEIAELGVAAFDAVSNIGGDFVEAMGELGDIATLAAGAVVDGFEAIDLAAAKSGAAAIDAAKKQGARLELEQQRLKEVFDLQAEQQRQIRDDVNKTIETRIAANVKLGGVLKEQSELEKASINQRIANLQLQNRLLGETEERNLQIIALTNELAEVDARVAGFKSEQLINENSLLKEKQDLVQSISDTELEASRIEAQAEIDLMESKAMQAEAQIALDEKVYNAERALLDKRLADTVEGTQAYADAVNERALLDANYNANKKKKEQEQDKFEIDIAKKTENAKVSIANSAFDLVQGFAEESAVASKILAVAQATMNTYQGVTAALAQTTDPTPGQVIRFANAAAVGVAGILNVKKILSTKTPGGGSGGGGSAPSAPSAPSVGQAISLANPNTGNNNIGTQIQQGLEGGSVRAYVVGSDVSGQQQLDREISANGTF